MKSSPSQATAVGLAAAFSACFLLLFLALRTNHYTAVDGAVRCLGVFFRGRHFHGNNHMLYPVVVEQWANLNKLVGNRPRDPFQYLRMSQALNGFACALSIGCVCYLIALIAGVRAAVLGSVLFGFSGAMTLQGTSSNEPPAGIFFALFALVLLSIGLRYSSIILMFVAGFLMALALASYEAAGTVVGAAILFCFFWPVPASSKPMAVFPRLVVTGAGSVFGAVIIYGWAYASQGVPAAKMLSRFLDTGGEASVYAGWSLVPSKVLNTSFGFLQWLFSGVPDDYAGVRSLLHHPHRWMWVAAVIAGFALTAAIGILTFRGWRAIGRPLPFLQILMILAICVFITVPLWAWGPNNPKMWLFPQACLVFLVAVAWGLRSLPPRAQHALTACLLICLVVEVARSMPSVIREHANPTPHLDDAAEVARIVGPEDRIVLDFDETSSLWDTIWGNGRMKLMLPSSNVAEATEWLQQAKAETRAGHGRLFFLGLLETPKAQWDPFMGARVKIPYEFLDEYRKGSVLVKPIKEGDPPEELRQFISAPQ
jgi:hypothetical protein